MARKQAGTAEEKMIFGDVTNRLFAVAIDLAILYVPLVILTSIGLSIFFDVSNQLDLTKAKVYSTNPELLRDPQATMAFIMANYPADMVIIIRQWIFSFAFNFFLIGVYTVPFIYKYGATPGKMFVGLQVIDVTTEGKLTFSQSVIRYLSYIVSIPFGLIFAGFRRDRRAWHDYLGDSMVIYNPNRWYKKHTDRVIARIKKFFNLR